MRVNRPIKLQHRATQTLAAAALFIGSSLVATSALAARHYTERQLAALATRTGKTFWVVPVDGRTPAFLSAPDAQARSFRAPVSESFEITELVGRTAKNPYYKVKFASGKEGYLRAETFLEEFNTTIVTLDPRADEKKNLAEQSAEEKKRIEWIQAQPWSPAVKEAALKRQAIPGMTGGEVKRVLGPPSRTTRVKSPHSVHEEHWFYPDAVLILHNGIVSRIDVKTAKE